MTESTFSVFHPDSADLMSILLQRLAVIDPCFEEEQRQFQLTLECMKKALKKEANMSVEAYISSLDILFSSKLFYIAWQGVSWNLDCFRNPAAKLRLDSDYEDLHGEMFFQAIPQIRAAENRISQNAQCLPSCCQEFTEKINNFYAYLETVGFKLMHYWGFLWANDFFPKVIPGYVADTVFTARYAHMLGRNLDIKLVG